MTSKNRQNDRQDLLVYGASGHAKVVIDTLEKQARYRVACLIDDDASLKGQMVYGYQVFGGKQDIETQPCRLCLVAIGDNRIRSEVANWLASNGFSLADAAIHPSVQLARGASIDRGSVVMAGAVINSDSHIGSNSIVNSRATVDHDCSIGDAVHLSPGTVICGGVSVGSFSLIGAGATIHPNARIGRNVTVGAGATVLDDIADNLVVAGTPARELASR